MTRNHGHIVLYILFVWFVISFVTNIIGPLMPIIIRDFSLSLALAGVLPFSFFMAYGVVSIPAGIMVRRFAEHPAWLRFGLPGGEAEWQRLERALASVERRNGA